VPGGFPPSAHARRIPRDFAQKPRWQSCPIPAGSPPSHPGPPVARTGLPDAFRRGEHQRAMLGGRGSDRLKTLALEREDSTVRLLPAALDHGIGEARDEFGVTRLVEHHPGVSGRVVVLGRLRE
jgi:hypothetical protein